jgi:hypothetical protein
VVRGRHPRPQLFVWWACRDKDFLDKLKKLGQRARDAIASLGRQPATQRI